MRSRIIEALNLGNWDFLVPGYNFLLVAALLLGCWLTLRQCRQQKIPQGHALQAVFYALLLVFPLAHLVYALQYPDRYADIWQFLDLGRGGIALYGGLMAAVLVPSVYLHSKGIRAGRFLDSLTPALALGLFVGRLGCFSAECNWGTRTELPWGVCFPGPKHAYAQQLRAGMIEVGSRLSLPVHPTQLYEAFFGLLMLPWIYRWLQADLGPGKVFLRAVSYYALFRFLSEFIRGDAAGLSFGGLSFAQGISILVLGLCQLALHREHLGFPSRRLEAR